MATIKSYTDIEQSKKLVEIVPIKSADMYYDKVTKIPYYSLSGSIPKDWAIPCWSLAVLLNILPDELEDNYFLTLEKEGKEYCCCYEDNNGNSFKHTFADNPVDACYEMIIELNELNLLQL